MRRPRAEEVRGVPDPELRERTIVLIRAEQPEHPVALEHGAVDPRDTADEGPDPRPLIRKRDRTVERNLVALGGLRDAEHFPRSFDEERVRGVEREGDRHPRAGEMAVSVPSDP